MKEMLWRLRAAFWFAWILGIPPWRLRAAWVYAGTLDYADAMEFSTTPRELVREELSYWEP